MSESMKFGDIRSGQEFHDELTGLTGIIQNVDLDRNEFLAVLSDGREVRRRLIEQR